MMQSPTISAMPPHSTPINGLKHRTHLEVGSGGLNTSGSILSPFGIRGNGANTSVNQTPCLPNVDDDAEIQHIVVRKQVSRRSIQYGLQDSMNSSFNESINKGATYDEKEVRTEIQICNKLFSENKITLKNAWQVRVIDLLNQLVGKGRNANNQDSDILQTATQSLEVAGKVYGLRVDSLHSDALRLAAHFARTFKQNAKEQRDDGDNSDGAIDDEPEGGQRKKREKKKKKRFGLSKGDVINENPNAWSGALPKLESATFSAKNDVSMSPNENLLTNQLKMDHSGCFFMLLSKEKAWIKLARDQTVLDPPRQFPIVLPKVDGNFHLCPPFKDFVIDEWDPDKEKLELEIRSASQHHMLGEVVLDENGVPLHELDGSLHDMFADRTAFDEEEYVEEEILPNFRAETEFITDLMPLRSISEHSDYSFNPLLETARGRIDQIWAGPSHWKFKYIRSNSVTYSGRDIQKQVRPLKRKIIEEEEDIDIVDMVHEFQRDIEVLRTQKTVKYVEKEMLIVPLLDFLCKQITDSVDNLMILPNMKSLRTNKKADIECDLPVYNYQNPTDDQYCPNNGDDEPDLADDIFGSDDRDDDHTVIQEDVNHQAAIGDNLIDAPEMVAQTYVPFALRAKKMDMKKLKLAIWKFLTKSNKDEILPDVPIHRTTFSELFANLPSLLPESMKQELSCALAFSALLHLANDLYLVMPKRENDITDFDIYK